VTAPILIVSPHLDDAVLSLGGAIARWSETREVVIATVFTQGPNLDEVEPALRVFADYTTRRAEDTAACAAIGARACWLGHVERVFRTQLPRLGFFKTRVGDFPAVPQIASSLDRVVDGIGAPELVLAPLAIGNHVDHVETLLATVAWVSRRGISDRLRGYEDFYALSGLLRRAHPVARRRMWPARRAPLLGAPRLAKILRSIALAREGPELGELWPALDAAWRVEPAAIDEARGLAAVACYGSQCEAFGGFAGIAGALRAYHELWGGEPVWTLASRASPVRVE
jgi:LmbE family N-acetylglucosaminyl deacetylase